MKQLNNNVVWRLKLGEENSEPEDFISMRGRPKLYQHPSSALVLHLCRLEGGKFMFLGNKREGGIKSPKF